MGNNARQPRMAMGNMVGERKCIGPVLWLGSPGTALVRADLRCADEVERKSTKTKAPVSEPTGRSSNSSPSKPAKPQAYVFKCNVGMARRSYCRKTGCGSPVSFYMTIRVEGRLLAGDDPKAATSSESLRVLCRDCRNRCLRDPASSPPRTCIRQCDRTEVHPHWQVADDSTDK